MYIMVKFINNQNFWPERWHSSAENVPPLQGTQVHFPATLEHSEPP